MRRALACLVCVVALVHAIAAVAAETRLKDLGRFLGWRDNMLVGYGLVTGLAGSGDTPRSRVTRQALANLLSQFDLAIPEDEIQSRNVAAVMVTAVLPPSANVGDKLDINVTSIGDARSLAGGVLLMTPLRGPDRQMYALAQGAVSIGGYRFDANGNMAQKNHPTTGVVSDGATVEAPVRAELVTRDGAMTYVLKQADLTTARRVAERINGQLGANTSEIVDAATVRIRVPSTHAAQVSTLAATIENLRVTADQVARVVVNERTGTVVAGGDVQIAPVAIAHGDIRVAVTTEFSSSQPVVIGDAPAGVRSLVLANSKLEVAESARNVTVNFPNTTIADLVQGLARLKVSTRDTIAILQAVKAAGALYADLVIQ